MLKSKVKSQKRSKKSVLMPTSTVEMHGESETLQPTLLNLADGRLLRVGVSIEKLYRMSSVVTAAPETPVEGRAASNKSLQLSDAVVRVMGAYSSSDLLKPEDAKARRSS